MSFFVVCFSLVRQMKTNRPLLTKGMFKSVMWIALILLDLQLEGKQSCIAP